MPTLAASRAEAGRDAPGINSSNVTEPPAETQPAPRLQTSMRSEPLGSLIQRATIPSVEMGPARTFAEFRLEGAGYFGAVSGGEFPADVERELSLARFSISVRNVRTFAASFRYCRRPTASASMIVQQIG